MKKSTLSAGITAASMILTAAATVANANEISVNFIQGSGSIVGSAGAFGYSAANIDGTEASNWNNLTIPSTVTPGLYTFGATAGGTKHTAFTFQDSTTAAVSTLGFEMAGTSPGVFTTADTTEAGSHFNGSANDKGVTALAHSFAAC